MLYVGKSLPSAKDRRIQVGALLNPTLKVATRPEYTGFIYGRTFGALRPAERAAYLDWLAAGRGPHRYAFTFSEIFLCGIERRALLDARFSDEARAEIPALLDEVRRLMELEGNSAFRYRGRRFIDLVDALRQSHTVLEKPSLSRAPETPLSISERMTLGLFARDRRPLPAEWALRWAYSFPKSLTRTPGERCPEEFAATFKDLYGRHKEIVLPSALPPIRLDYYSADHWGMGAVTLLQTDIPDVGLIPEPVRTLRRLAEETADALSKYSRWLGRGRDGAALEAVALLPAAAASFRAPRSYHALKEQLESGAAGEHGALTTPVADLIAPWPELASLEDERLSKAASGAMAQILELLGIGIEPDVRRGGALLETRGEAHLFLLPQPPKKASSASRKGADASWHDHARVQCIAVDLSAAVAVADGDATHRAREALLATAVDLARDHTRDGPRLVARAHAALAAPPPVAALRRALKDVPSEEKRMLAEQVVRFATRTGEVGPGKLKLLSVLYPLLGLPADRLYGDIHAEVAAEAALPTGPHTAAQARPASRAGARKRKVGDAEVSLDLGRVAHIEAQSSIVSDVLQAIFSTEDAPLVGARGVDAAAPSALAEGTATASTLTGSAPAGPAAARTSKRTEPSRRRPEAASVPEAERAAGQPEQNGVPPRAARTSSLADAPGGPTGQRGGSEGNGLAAGSPGSLVGGLDAAHTTLFRRMLANTAWSRTDFEILAESLGLMPAGALETLNEAAFDACGEPLLEGDDPIEINEHAATELSQP
jgi:hypothetical protein